VGRKGSMWPVLGGSEDTRDIVDVNNQIDIEILARVYCTEKHKYTAIEIMKKKIKRSNSIRSLTNPADFERSR
jgi:hypothetical protein